MGGATTDALGEYVLPLPDGTYRISFRPAPDSPYAISYWKDGTSFLSGTDVVVRGTHMAGLDMALKRGHTIRGTIRSASTGAALADQFAVAYFGGTENCSQFAFVASARSGPSGEYAFMLRPGTYRILFQGSPASAYRNQWWKEVSDCAQATPITLAGEPTPTGTTIVSGIDARLSPP